MMSSMTLFEIDVMYRGALRLAAFMALRFSVSRAAEGALR